MSLESTLFRFDHECDGSFNVHPMEHKVLHLVPPRDSVIWTKFMDVELERSVTRISSAFLCNLWNSRVCQLLKHTQSNRTFSQVDFRLIQLSLLVYDLRQK